MHLDEQQRRQAMPNLAALLRPGGTIIMKIRHGPVPPGRRMFEVGAEETIELARIEGLHPVLNVRTEFESGKKSRRRSRAGSTWHL